MKVLRTFESSNPKLKGKVLLVQVENSLNNGRLYLRVDPVQFALCDWPIRYHDGRIAYDYPEHIPQYLKRLTEKAFTTLKNEGISVWADYWNRES